MIDLDAGVVQCVHLDDSHVILTLDAGEIAAAARPGQFLMLGVGRATDPLLRRPLGIMDVSPPLVEVFFQVVGKGTALLAACRPQDRVPVLGPLGKAFPPVSGRRILAIAGGRGIAPLVYALKQYRAMGDTQMVNSTAKATACRFCTAPVAAPPSIFGTASRNWTSTPWRSARRRGISAARAG